MNTLDLLDDFTLQGQPIPERDDPDEPETWEVELTRISGVPAP